MRISRTVALSFTLALGCGQTATVTSYFSPAGVVDPTIARGSLTPRIASSMHAKYLSDSAQREPLVALRPTDGSELLLETVKARVQIEGPVARTELHFTFHNTEQRTREGKFSVVLPSDAAVGRLAMRVHGVMREARIVSREQGRKVFETLLQRRIDPALLEQDHGNTFSARVFPIFAGEHKEIVISYDQRVSQTQPLVVPLAGLTPVSAGHVVVEHVSGGVTERREIALVAGTAIDEIAIAASTGSVALVDGDAFVARVELPSAPAAAPFDRTAIFVDTSASRAEIMTKQATLLRELLATLPESSHVIVGAYDQDVTELYRGPAGGAGHAADLLLKHGALGGSNLGAALTRAVATGATRLVLVGDGLPTFGEHEPARLVALVESRAARGSATGLLQRIDAIQVGATVDRGTLASIVRAGRLPGAIVDGRDRARAFRQLAAAVPREVPIQVAGALATWPSTTRDLAAGEPVWVFGRLAHPDATKLAITVGDKAIAVTPKRVTPVKAAADALTGEAKTPVARMAARAEIAALTERMVHAAASERPTLAKQIESIAMGNYLVSSETSLIVLENDADEQRFLGDSRIQITGKAPTIDPTSTTQGITITRDYIRNIPVPGRTFEAVLGAVAGSQGDGLGISFSGSTSLENVYYIDGINTTGLTTYGGGYGTTAMPLAVEQRASFIKSNAFALGQPSGRSSNSYTPPAPQYPAAHDGEMLRVVEARASGHRDRALEIASEWQLANPGDVAAIVALGESLEARGAHALAARAYSSLVDLYPGRAELVRGAAERLDRLASSYPAARSLAIDAYRRALRDRPDHASSYRLLAWSLVRRGLAAGTGTAELDEALDLLATAIVKQTSPNTTYVLARDMGLVGAAIVARDPSRRASVMARMRYGLPDKPSMQVVLAWETDANDVDLHVADRHGGRASPKSMTVPGTGGEAIDDANRGYGPELFRVEEPTGYPYKLAAHYYSKGAMGIALGTVQIVHHDGRGNLVVEDRPFVIQNDHAMLDLGTVEAPRFAR